MKDNIIKQLQDKILREKMRKNPNFKRIRELQQLLDIQLEKNKINES